MTPIKYELWMPDEPIDAFFFDCDGTLSLMEGIDVLAEMNGVGEQVKEITQRCMAVTGLSLADYRERLLYVKPSKKQLDELAELYRTHRAPGALETIQLLQSIGKKIYIISAGIKAALLPLAHDLGIPPERVLAVDVYFDDKGHYAGFNEKSYLVQAEGKNRQINEVLKKNERSLLLGDGFSDWEAHTVVTRFIGFSGLSPKTWVRTHSEFFITSSNIYPVINLGLTHEEQMNLAPEFRNHYEHGLFDIQNGFVLMQGVKTCTL